MTKIKAVLFDWGGVLIDDPGEKMKKFCARTLGAEAEKFNQIFNKYVPDFHMGKITERKLWSSINRELGLKNKITHSLWTEAYKQYYFPRPDMFKLARQLRRHGFKIALLSNTEKPIISYANNKYYKRMKLFNDIIASCYVGCIKPGKKIYKIALRRLKVKPTEALLIDDREENIISAKKVGIKTILFKNYRRLLKDLRCY
jgi:epoxide hydrolase-like predicted phosphatase